MWYWWKNRQIKRIWFERISEFDKRESEIDPHIYSQLISDKGAKAVITVFSTNGARTGHPFAQQQQKNESRHRPYTLHKNLLKMDHRPKCKMQNYKTSRT